MSVSTMMLCERTNGMFWRYWYCFFVKLRCNCAIFVYCVAALLFTLKFHYMF